MVKNLPANAGDIRDLGLIPGLRRSPGEGHGNPLQDSCLENPTDRGAWRAKIHGIAELDTIEQLTLLVRAKIHNEQSDWTGVQVRE